MYALVRLTLGSGERITISEEEFNILKSSRDIITNSVAIESNFHSVCESFKLMEINYFTHSMDELLYNPFGVESFYQIRSSYNALLLASLSTARLYTDSIISHAMSIAGKSISKKEFQQIIKKRSQEIYEYRVMEAIRNYAQHRAFPVHGLSIGSEWVEGENLSSTDYFFHADEVEKYDRFEKRVLDEIKDFGGVVNLRKFYRIYFNSICDIHEEFRALMLPHLENAEQNIDIARKKWKLIIEDQSLIGVVGCKLNGDLLCESIKPVYIKASGDKILKHLKSKMLSFKNMQNRRVKL